MKFLWITFSILLVNLSCGHSDLGQKGTKPPSHEIFDKFLKKFVSEEGKVDYKGMLIRKAELEAYLEILSQNPPDRTAWTHKEQLAYWINAYNAFTLKLILEHYPVKSIQDIKPKYPLPLINTVWHMEFFKIGGKPASLDEIEHKILRKEFDEPRIHFAINCASFSCPILSRDAYVPEKLEEQLDMAARRFINDPKRNKIRADRVEVSKIFSWFGEDFTRNGSLIDYLNRYSKIKISPKAKINHLDYDWSLNE
ncbi:DUF547 domain-containing protein [Cecembia calidifontis]|uniref:Uncharacterized protein DUF547 n=1 Tax=Cecembia calidifontis TaxID=1187080 RepID=A0A4Q7P859_9BACT|nr:DUF547 domain-containing protein [Cecembia calidifontis]RZS96265.1 uncharacterized protein DUF547 [Cecembia calidifontis]